MSAQNQILIRGGLIVTMNPKREVFHGDMVVADGVIRTVSRSPQDPARFSQVIDASGQFVIPGLIQAHTHLCQALFRGCADDLELLDWLKLRIWPMEHAHNKKSIAASALIGCLEMQKCGTTSILDMGTVAHTHELLEAVATTGIRYWGGKCLMDLKKTSGPLFEPTARALGESEELLAEWRSRGRVRYALCPRFAISCSDEILEATAALSASHQVLIHTHASENREEVRLIRARTGVGNIVYLQRKQLLSERTVIAHGIHVSESEITKMAEAGASVVHCPSSNLKLASGIARIDHYLKRKLNVALGCDGAACNNMMDPFVEMRLAALLQKPLAGPKALPAQKAFELATRGGARALGMEHELGSLEVGKRADVVTVGRSHPAVATVENPYSALVYSCTGRDVRHVLVDGELVVKDGEHQRIDESATIALARRELAALLKRLG